jgi:hypothetical protein
VNTGCGDKCTSLLAGLNVALQESALQGCGRKEEEHPSPKGHDGKVQEVFRSTETHGEQKSHMVQLILHIPNVKSETVPFVWPSTERVL